MNLNDQLIQETYSKVCVECIVRPCCSKSCNIFLNTARDIWFEHLKSLGLKDDPDPVVLVALEE